MMTSTYDSLPSRFDWSSYYAQQAAGMPQFPVFRARQRGGFLVPLLKAHGIPLLRWLGKQAASLATTAGTQYLNKGSLTKDDMKGLLKKQGKVAANSVLDRLKQQVGSGMMNHRRDMRLHSLLTPSAQQDGLLTNVHRLRGPNLFPMTNRSRGGVKSRVKRRRRKATASVSSGRRGKKKKTASKKKKAGGRKTAKSSISSSASRKNKKKSKTTTKRKSSAKRRKKTTTARFNHTIFS
jgi:hypothetical protein